MDDDELMHLQTLSGQVATMSLQNAVDAINQVFGAGTAKMDSPLLAAVFTAQTQFMTQMITAAAAMAETDLFEGLELADEDDEDDEDDDDDDFILNS
jgi:hypothetical protein